VWGVPVGIKFAAHFDKSYPACFIRFMDRTQAVKSILGNTLMQEIVAIRLDTLWRMIGLVQRGFLPDIHEEGATGKFDNKGAIFIPGGLIPHDVDEKPIDYQRQSGWDGAAFRRTLRRAMKYDNATLLFPDGMAMGVNLDSGFFSRAARRINTFKKAAFRRKSRIGPKMSLEISSDDIVRSHTPTYITPPFGARTRISTCIAAALVEPPLYFAYLKTEFNLSGKQAEAVMEAVDLAQEPGRAKDGSALYPPYVVVCHDTRYKNSALTGMTRILGIGKFGEFATFTLERLGRRTVNELKRKGLEPEQVETMAAADDIRVLGMLRIYAQTNPGKRSPQYDLYVVSPRKDLELDAAAIESEARKRYAIGA